MKKIIASFALFSMFVSCTKDLGTLKNISTRDFNPDRNYELAIKQQPFTANSIEACVNLALKAVPNASFLKNTNITSKGKKVTIVTDIWSMTKEKPKKPKKSKKPKSFKKLPEEYASTKSIGKSLAKISVRKFCFAKVRWTKVLRNC